MMYICYHTYLPCRKNTVPSKSEAKNLNDSNLFNPFKAICHIRNTRASKLVANAHFIFAEFSFIDPRNRPLIRLIS